MLLKANIYTGIILGLRQEKQDDKLLLLLKVKGIGVDRNEDTF